MKRLVLVLLTTLLVLCGYQWRSLRIMKAEIETLRTDVVSQTQQLALRQFDEEHHDEVRRTIAWLDSYYRAREGLQRPKGLCTDERLDADGLTVWLFDTYLRMRVDGGTEGMARQKVLESVKRSGEWQSLHPGTR